MRYLMLVRVAPGAGPSAGQDADPDDWAGENDAAGRRLVGERLRPSSDATTVRVRDGATLVTHGPFVEVAEEVAGFDLLEVASPQEAVAVAAAHPVATFGALELRRLAPHVTPDGSPDDAPYLPGGFDYVLLMGAEPGAPAPGPGEGGLPAAWIAEMAAADADRGGSPLTSADEAITVRIRDGETLVVHGPFADLAEQVAGYNLLQVPDLDAAIAAAASHPAAGLGAIEIRPTWPF